MSLTILPISDIHLDLHRAGRLDALNLQGVDVLSIAGDFTTKLYEDAPRFLEALRVRTQSTGTHIVFVLGNHDHYGTTILRAQEQMKKTCEGAQDVHFLCRDVVTIKGQRFIGCTLWYTPAPGWQVTNWPDVRFIHKFTPSLEKEAQRDKEYLLDTCKDGDVVITHMLPSSLLVSPKWQGSSVNGFFVHAGVAEAVLSRATPKLWHFGHTHERVDVKLGDVQFTCNPLGYPGEEPGTDFARKVVL